MQSHLYHFSGRQIVRALAPSLAIFLACVAALHLADMAGWLAFQAGDPGLRHQAKASRSRNPAQIVFVGDSTCWCGIDATALSQELPGHAPAINLSLYVGIDLGWYGQLTADFAAANPGQVRWVVLLVSTGKLTGEGQSDQDDLWRKLRLEYAGGQTRSHDFWNPGDLLGRRLLRERLAAYVLPEVLRGRGAGTFGFASEMDAFMTAHNGGLFDFGELIPQPSLGVSDWLLSPKFQPACRRFREAMVPGVKLAIGLTPTLLSKLPPDAKERYESCLQNWNAWMHADLVLTNLPVALPTMCFAPGGHLNALGQKLFTSAVARELAPAWR